MPGTLRMSMPITASSGTELMLSPPCTVPTLSVARPISACSGASKLAQFSFDAPEHALMGRATLNVGTVHGGLNINSVPDEAVIGIDIRSVPGIDHQHLLERLRRHLGESVEVTSILNVQSVFSEPSDPWMQSVFELM